MNDDVTILVNSCDRYKDTWYPYFYLLRKQWPNCPYRIVLNVEKETFNFKGVDVFHIGGSGQSELEKLLKRSIVNIYFFHSRIFS